MNFCVWLSWEFVWLPYTFSGAPLPLQGVPSAFSLSQPGCSSQLNVLVEFSGPKTMKQKPLNPCEAQVLTWHSPIHGSHGLKYRATMGGTAKRCENVSIFEYLLADWTHEYNYKRTLHIEG